MIRIKMILLCAVLSLIGTVAFAQTVDWLWAAGAGGVLNDSGKAITTDNQGNSIVVGYFSGTATFGNITLTTPGGYAVFVAKINSTGSYLWAKKANGPDDGVPNIDWGYGVTTDAANNIYITGYYSDTIEFDSITLEGIGQADIFVAKLDSNGNWLWAKRAGGIRNDYSNAITADSNGNVYVTGCFSYAASFGAYNLTNYGNTDVFVAKMDADGEFLWAKGFGGMEHDYGYALAKDSNGYVYVTGIYRGTAHFGTLLISSNGDFDFFIVKIDTNGNCVWVKGNGGSVSDWAYSIAVDSDSNIYVTGSFTGTMAFPIVDSVTGTTLSSTGNADIFVAKMNDAGGWLWAKKAGGTNSDFSTGICIGTDNRLYLTGYFTGAISFVNQGLTLNLETAGNEYDVAVVAMNMNGDWIWAKKSSGTNSEFSYALSVDSNNDLYIVGNYYATGVFGTNSILNAGASDVFVVKMGTNIVPVANDDDTMIKPNFALLQNYPNPFNPTTTISFTVKESAPVQMEIYNQKGQLVKTLVNEAKEAGIHNLAWDGTDQSGKSTASGVYYYKMTSGKFSSTRKMILMK